MSVYRVPALQQVAAATATTSSLGSSGVESLIGFLNSGKGQKLANLLALENKQLGDELQSANFWTGGSATVVSATCVGIVSEGIQLDVVCDIKGKRVQRQVVAPFTSPVTDETALKLVLIDMATKSGRIGDTALIASLPFGHDCSVPLDFLFNNVPHPTWVRAYLYDAATTAVLRAVNDEKIRDKSRLQVKVNFPEVNPAFDTYRIGTILEMVRAMVLALTCDEGKRVRVCVQQSLGEGVFTGLPLALASMRIILEKMDWGPNLTKEQKWQAGDNLTPRSEALIRLGTIGADQYASDDDVVIVVSPQNVIGGMIVELLEDMCKAAAGRPLVLINPNLADRPSSNNMMQIRGRSERRAFQDSFVDIYALRLLYPSSGGYMFPIRGMIGKKDFRSPWVAYLHTENEAGRDEYRIAAAFPPFPPPDPNVLSQILMVDQQE